jgi:hypothetical protein
MTQIQRRQEQKERTFTSSENTAACALRREPVSPSEASTTLRFSSKERSTTLAQYSTSSRRRFQFSAIHTVITSRVGGEGTENYGPTNSIQICAHD